MGRRIARLSGLTVTGSIGVLVRAKREEMDLSLADAIRKMKEQGPWLSEKVVRLAVQQAGKMPKGWRPIDVGKNLINGALKLSTTQ